MSLDRGKRMLEIVRLGEKSTLLLFEKKIFFRKMMLENLLSATASLADS